MAEVYRAIFGGADSSLGTLQMLTNIEAKLEELLSIIGSMPPAEVEAAEKQKEKERRQRVPSSRRHRLRRPGGAHSAVDPPFAGARQKARGQAGDVPLRVAGSQEESDHRRRQQAGRGGRHQLLLERRLLAHVSSAVQVGWLAVTLRAPRPRKPLRSGAWRRRASLMPWQTNAGFLVAVAAVQVRTFWCSL